MPVENTRLLGSPLIFCATTVSTSHGLVTSTYSAFGACSSSCGISDFRMFTLVAARSSRV